METTTPKSSMWHTVSRLFTITALIAITQTACVHQSTRQISPSCSEAKINQMHSFYVRQHSDDNYKLGETIAGELKKMGYTATTGTAKNSPQKVDAVITYMDRWMWDITMYMLSLDVQLLEPGTDMSLASAKTVRTSLIRKSQQEMSRETLAKLLGKPEE